MPVAIIDRRAICNTLLPVHIKNPSAMIWERKTHRERLWIACKCLWWFKQDPFLFFISTELNRIFTNFFMWKYLAILRTTTMWKKQHLNWHIPKSCKNISLHRRDIVMDKRRTDRWTYGSTAPASNHLSKCWRDVILDEKAEDSSVQVCPRESRGSSATETEP